jgi:replicative DNA helicase
MNAHDPRIPPHSIEAEQSLIGGLLLDNTAWDRIADMVTEGDFYRDDHRRIFGHIRKLVETGRPADVVTIYESIEKSNEVDQTGGLAYLGEIANATPSAANIRRYAEIVSERARERGFGAVADDIQHLAGASAEPLQARIDRATDKLLALAEHGTTKSEPRQVGQIMSRVVDMIEARMNRGGEISGLPTGFTDVDRILDGLKGGDLVILAGRPSMGKTAFALNLAENVALNGKPVLVFSLEMGDTQLVTRSLSSVGGIDGRALASGRMDEEAWDKVTAAMGRLHEAPLFIDETPNLSVGQMRVRARRQKRKGGLSLVVIDYLQLMRGEGNNRNEQLGDITRSLKLMARDLDVPVICLSQLSRECEKRADKRPMLSDLRESGSIEQDADVVLMMYRDDYYDPQSHYCGVAECLIRKNRMGACGDMKLAFQPEFSRFRDFAGEDLRRFDHARATAKAKQGRRRGFDE